MASHKNRLAQETSPYLLQHAHNPVDWHPWGSEALEKAKQLDRPILLSSGYSACHWCHVMERESFENQEIAELMNSLFVSIKVDREERPDIDAIYMNYVQMSTGHGGWPLTVFLTPEQVPFFGGTYFPPRDLGGRPGFKTILRSVSRFYQEHSEEIADSAGDLRASLGQTVHISGDQGSALTTGLLQETTRLLLRQSDQRYGGFGSAPKFPAAMALSFLLRNHTRLDRQGALEAVELSLTRMAQGGIYDQLGGGFHRYSVDDRWFAPHFEKMLYDNALLARVYLQAYQVTGREFYRRITEETLDYMARDLLSEEGGFYSAEDADSEGVEGRFYTWEQSEIESLLQSEEASLFADYFGVSRDGNWEGTNILHRPSDLSDLTRQNGNSLEELVARLDRSRSLLMEARSKRIRPALDDKVLAAWNGLALTAFAEAAFVLSSSHYLHIANRNAEFLSENLSDGEHVFRSWKSGKARLNGYLEDYAQVIEGMLALYQAGGDSRWFRHAVALTESALHLFWDDQAGDFYFTAETAAPLLIRPKEHFDNATPSGNSTMAMNLLRLYELTGEREYRERSGRLLSGITSGVSRYPTAFGNWLQAIDFYVGPTRTIVLNGGTAAREKLEEPLRRTFLPRTVVAYSSSDCNAPPVTEGKESSDQRALAYVCEDFTCRNPTDDPDELRRILER